MLSDYITAAVMVVDGHCAQTGVVDVVCSMAAARHTSRKAKSNGHWMARLVPSTPSLRWMATFAVPADKKLPASITDPPFGPSHPLIQAQPYQAPITP